LWFLAQVKREREEEEINIKAGTWRKGGQEGNGIGILRREKGRKIGISG
jgi:hypothetical protein